jgi:hypothetical protein
MSETQPDPAEADVQDDPLGFAYAARLKAERRRGLHEALTGGPPPEPGVSARDRLEQLLDPETLATVDEHMLTLLAEREPADTDVTATATSAPASKADRKRALADALHGHRPQPPETTRPSAGFDGGARAAVPPPPPSHDEWLAQVIRTRAADRGVGF